MNEEATQLEPGVLTGVTKPTITKIRETNIVTVESLAAQTPSQLAKDADIGEDTASNAITKARVYLHSGFITGDQLLDKLSRRTRLTTGSKAVDKILGGGIESETTTEIAAANGVGKTQFASGSCSPGNKSAAQQTGKVHRDVKVFGSESFPEPLDFRKCLTDTANFFPAVLIHDP
ncbi:MAG: hypothetical protein KKH60_01875 [Proteobacteria bacterium]|nr:hypothetical protein [Pseudomonadota bacterium]